LGRSRPVVGGIFDDQRVISEAQRIVFPQVAARGQDHELSIAVLVGVQVAEITEVMIGGARLAVLLKCSLRPASG
jgi:hypothetical protein